jgi:hypothetical protein
MKRNVRLYVAILNRGWLRREMYPILDKMKETQGVDVYVEPFGKSWGNPIFSNRNRICRRFLDKKPKQDYLLMMDNDVIPLHNPAEIVHAKKDIVGSPAKVRQRGRTINWVAYVNHPHVEGYIPVDFENVDSDADLVTVDIIGTGCILIKRRVIENLFKLANGNGWDAPFTIEVDEWGGSHYGTDFAFCRRAQKAGYKIYTTPHRVCEHVKEIGLLDISSYDSSDGRDMVLGKYAYAWDDYTISQQDWYFLRDIIEKEDVHTVLEFGSGASSLLMSEIAEVHSFETDPAHIKRVQEAADATPNTVNMLSMVKWDGKSLPKGIKPIYDLAFVDGPPGKGVGGPGREHSMKYASKHAKRVIVHDAGRVDEMRWQNKYLKPDFKLMKRSGWHLQRCNYWVKR